MKKRFLVTMLISAMLVSTLVGCGSKQDTNKNVANEVTSSVETDAEVGNEASEDVSLEDVSAAEMSVKETSIEETSNESDTTSTSEESGDVVFSRGDSWIFPNHDGLTNKGIFKDNEDTSANITMVVSVTDEGYVDDTFEYGFYWEGPSEIGVRAVVKDDHVGIANKENTFAIAYYPSATPTSEVQVEPSNGANPDDLMITNGQFTYYFTKDYDQDKAMSEFNSFKLIATIEECNALVNEFFSQTAQ